MRSAGLVGVRVIRRAREEQGQALVEFALVLPLLIVLVMGILQFGIIYNRYITLTDAVRVGARNLSLQRSSTSTDPCDPAINATVAAGSDISLIASHVSVTWASGSTSTCGSGSAGSYTGGSETEGDAGTVTATTPYTISIMGIPVYSGNLSASATDSVE